MSERAEIIEISFTVAPQYEGLRLDQYISARIPRLSRSRIQKMIRAQPELGGTPMRPAMRVQRGQKIAMLRPAPIEPDVPRDYEVLYADDALIAICKPAGLPVHATATYHHNTLTALLRERFPGQPVPRLVHRLDRETSGVLLLACQPQAEVVLKKALARRTVHKTYLAIVTGNPDGSGTIDQPIGPDDTSEIRIKQHVREDGQPACTRYRTLDRRGPYALVEASPETGRQHQIRVHLAAIGCPIVGDKIYGIDPGAMLEFLETGWTDDLAERLILPRHALHAAAIRFAHPLTGQPLSISCPLTPDLEGFWASLSCP